MLHAKKLEQHSKTLISNQYYQLTNHLVCIRYTLDNILIIFIESFHIKISFYMNNCGAKQKNGSVLF